MPPDLSPVLVRKMWSLQRTGEECPVPGSSTFQLMSASVILAGTVWAWLTPVPFGPRKRVHSCASARSAKRVSAAITKVAARIAFMRSLKRSSTPLDNFERGFLHWNSFETASEVGQGFFHTEAFETGRADKADAVGVFVDESSVFGRGNRAAVGEKDEVFAHRARAADDSLDALHRFVHRDHRHLHADAPAHRRADMGDDDVVARFGHGFGFRWRRDIDDGEQIHLARDRDHLEFLFHAHACFFEDLAEQSVHDAVRGKIIHAGEAHVLDLKQPVPHAPARVGGMHAADDGDFPDDGQDLELTDFHRHGVGIAVSHQTARGAVAGHAETSGIVNNDKIGPAAFDELGADAGAGAGGDDGLAFLKRCPKAFKDFFARVRISFSCPGIRHGLVWCEFAWFMWEKQSWNGQCWGLTVG